MDERSVVQREVEMMQVEANNFALRFINDSAVRLRYMTQVRQYSEEIFAHIERGEVSPAEAARVANQMRNEIMNYSRLRLSDLGRAVSQDLKANEVPLNTLVEKYASKLFKKPAAELTSVEVDSVFVEIVRSSGRANPRVTVRAIRLGRLGKGLLVVSLAVAVYNVATAENKVEAAERESVGFGAGILGGMAGGAVAGLVCGPGAPVCVAVGVFVGGVAFALGADVSFDLLKH